MDGAWQVGMGLAAAQHTDPEVDTAEKKSNMACVPSLLFRAAWAGRQMPLRSCAGSAFLLP